jgi:hypothetical protein
MVDRKQTVEVPDLSEYCVDIRHRGTPQPKVHKLCDAEYICVTMKRCYLTRGSEQNLIEVRL